MGRSKVYCIHSGHFDNCLVVAAGEVCICYIVRLSSREYRKKDSSFQELGGRSGYFVVYIHKMCITGSKASL
jgi:hypothetical protein